MYIYIYICEHIIIIVVAIFSIIRPRPVHGPRPFSYGDIIIIYMIIIVMII